ncbi:MAG: Uma2 family endonuclease [Anaerolineae bacterium]|nr:Uma2 family endonuclease [Anaerolineae bacterium]
MTVMTLPKPAVVRWRDMQLPDKIWTYADYLKLPEDGKRYEIIDGELYVANAPSYQHQYTVSKLVRRIGACIEAHDYGVVIAAPFEVHLPNIAKPVQPDVLFIATERVPQRDLQIFEGAPDLVVEVLSPGSDRYDRVVKFSAYERAGVREYWIANPKTRSITVYALARESQDNEEVLYTHFGEFGMGDTLQSSILPACEFAIADIFA